MSSVNTLREKGALIIDFFEMSSERIGKCRFLLLTRAFDCLGIERALPMFLLGIGCISVTAIVFGILYGNMIRARRLKFFSSKRLNERIDS